MENAETLSTLHELIDISLVVCTRVGTGMATEFCEAAVGATGCGVRVRED